MSHVKSDMASGISAGSSAPMVSHLPRDGGPAPMRSPVTSRGCCTAIWRLLYGCKKAAKLRLGSSIMGDSSSSPASYIRVVQHLIEQCLLLHMSKDECVEALSKHANIKPVITSTVWTELEKENRGFFEAYSKNREVSVMEMRAMQMAPNPLAADFAAPGDRPDDNGD